MVKEKDCQADEVQYSPEAIVSKIRAYICEHFEFRPDSVNISNDFAKDFSFDSFDRLELFVWCEDTFGIEISLDDADNIQNVGNLRDVILSKTAHG